MNNHFCVTDLKLDKLINESIQKFLIKEIIEDENMPDYIQVDGEIYDYEVDSSTCIIYDNTAKKWRVNCGGGTHRDIIALNTFGCEEWEFDQYFERAQIIFVIEPTLNRLWQGKDDKWLYPSRVYKAHEGHPYTNILCCWDTIDKEVCLEICNRLNLDPSTTLYTTRDKQNYIIAEM